MNIPALAPDHAPAGPPPPRSTGTPEPAGRATRTGMAAVLALVALAVAAILLAPVALSSRDLLDWAAAPSGLGLPDAWPVLVILSLDAAAVACVLMTVLCTWRGERPGVFGLLVWVFAITSAFANWRHGMTPGAPPDRFWFIPLMSLTGPGVLEVVLHRVRSWIARDRELRDTGDRSAEGPGWQRWVPGLGSFSDTLGAHRTRLLVPEVATFAEAVTAYRRLCPDGSVRVAAALRRRQLARAEAQLHADLNGAALLPGGGRPRAHLPVDLMKRIPVQHEPYQRWREVWTDLRDQPNPTGQQMQQIAERHGFSTRQIAFVRRAGLAGLLESPVPPAVRLAQSTNGAGPAAH